jgi:hypothetical protein
MTLFRSDRLSRDEAGAVLVEMALAIPMLTLLAVGSFEIGTMVSRQQELQSSLVEGEAIALAANDGAQTNLADIQDIISQSVGLDKSNVTLKFKYRCGLDAVLVDSKDTCSEDGTVSEYLNFQLTDQHVPVWTKFGFGSDITYKVERTVQLS